MYVQGMVREPAKKIPAGIVHARALINDLNAKSHFQINVANQYWSSAELVCVPFLCLLEFSKENIELDLKIVAGEFESSDSLLEVLGELPIEIEHSYSLIPNPVLTLNFNLPVMPNTQEYEIANFLIESVIKSLMVVQTALVTESFTPSSRNLFSSYLPKPAGLWNFGEIARGLLGHA